MKTLKEVSKALNISEYRASKIKKQIEADKYPNTPIYMIWGTGNKKRYNIKVFQEYINK